jgi:hypothetical protein
MNLLHPTKMSPDERIAEIAEILSAGFIRLRSAQSTKLSPQCADDRLDRSAPARMCGARTTMEKQRA